MADSLAPVDGTEFAAHRVTDSDNNNFGKILYITQARRFIWMVCLLIPAILKTVSAVPGVGNAIAVHVG